MTNEFYQSGEVGLVRIESTDHDYETLDKYNQGYVDPQAPQPYKEINELKKKLSQPPSPSHSSHHCHQLVAVGTLIALCMPLSHLMILLMKNKEQKHLSHNLLLQEVLYKLQMRKRKDMLLVNCKTVG